MGTIQPCAERRTLSIDTAEVDDANRSRDVRPSSSVLVVRNDTLNIQIEMLMNFLKHEISSAILRTNHSMDCDQKEQLNSSLASC